jgi:hypothetical protein
LDDSSSDEEQISSMSEGGSGPPASVGGTSLKGRREAAGVADQADEDMEGSDVMSISGASSGSSETVPSVATEPALDHAELVEKVEYNLGV